MLLLLLLLLLLLSCAPLTHTRSHILPRTPATHALSAPSDPLQTLTFSSPVPSYRDSPHRLRFRRIRKREQELIAQHESVVQRSTDLEAEINRVRAHAQQEVRSSSPSLLSFFALLRSSPSSLLCFASLLSLLVFLSTPPFSPSHPQVHRAQAQTQQHRSRLQAFSDAMRTAGFSVPSDANTAYWEEAQALFQGAIPPMCHTVHSYPYACNGFLRCVCVCVCVRACCIVHSWIVRVCCTVRATALRAATGAIQQLYGAKMGNGQQVDGSYFSSAELRQARIRFTCLSRLRLSSSVALHVIPLLLLRSAPLARRSAPLARRSHPLAVLSHGHRSHLLLLRAGCTLAGAR